MAAAETSHEEQGILSTGNARRSQSAVSFNFTKKQYENATSQLPPKRPREDLEEATLAVLIKQASTTTVTEESVNRN